MNNPYILLKFSNKLVKEALEHNDTILYSLSEILDDNSSRMMSFQPQMKTQLILLTQISDQPDVKFILAIQTD